MFDECITLHDKPLKKSTQNMRKSVKSLRVIACTQNSQETWQVYYRKLNARRARS